MTTKIEIEKRKIADKKKQIQMKERLLQAKSRKEKTKSLIRLGELFEKAQIHGMDHDILLGALLEIKDHSSDVQQHRWKERAEAFKESQSDSRVPLIISFSSEPEQEVLSRLKEMKFRWNKFRNEWYGYGVESEARAILKGTAGQLQQPEIS